MKSLLLLPLCILLTMAACDTQVKSTDNCGDGYLDPGEQCDGSETQASSCEQLGYYSQTGELKCKSDCTLDTSVCSSRCGDGVVQALYEQCEGDNLAGQNCLSQGLGAGTLACTADCHFDISGCEVQAVCGDDTISSPFEQCEGTNLDGATCVSLGYYDGVLSCSADCRYTLSSCISYGRCGDAILQTMYGEACEGSNLDGETCESLGFYGGTLTCGADCQFRTDGCESVGSCGDDLIQASFAEVCDGANLNGATCVSRGFHGGDLACATGCQAFDETDCAIVGRCGDATLQASFGEVCDGANLDGATCISRGYHGGTLACATNCQAFDESGCAAVGRCGDATVQTSYGEACDGVNLNNATCLTQGFYGGALACTAGCAFDTSDCATYGRCGDGTLHAAQGEACDGAELNGQTCDGLGFYGGLLACGPTCAFDTTSCAAVGRCGDATVQVGFGEVCDGANLAAQTCVTRGYYGGTLTCAADCLGFNETACAAVGRCGDTVVQTAHGEDCDGANLNGTACINLGYYGGELACTSGCDFDITDCEPFGRCGDNTIQGSDGEVCDGTSLAGQTCVSRGFHGGTLACAANCGSFDESGCVAVGRCGDGVIQAAYGEECDGTNLNSQTCGTFGFYEGLLTCDANCHLVTSGCSQRCGDDTTQLSHGELCDGTDLNGQSCVSRGYYDGTLVCNSNCLGFNETACIAAGRCGDALVQTLFGEDCDGANLNSQSCTSLGWYGGTLACQANCDFNLTSCASFGRCGDASIQTGALEVCDGTNLNYNTCITRGWYGGILACDANCRAFDETDCAAQGKCGDAVIQPAYNEVCDLNNLNSQTCLTRGWYGGTLTCQGNCLGFNESNCATYGRCGDNTLQKSDGEVCDTTKLDGQTCLNRGWYGGTLACNSDCQDFDETNCAAVGRCGDGIVQGGYGEDCDGDNLNGASCGSLGYYGGTLTCGSDCRFVISPCAAVGRCGDDVIQAAYDEVCDRSNLNSRTCVTQGYYHGELSCELDCKSFKTSNCIGYCGDGTAQTAYGESCDAGDLNNTICQDLGYHTGTIGCTPTCAFDLSSCQAGGFCGDNVIQNSYEVCDGTDLGWDPTGTMPDSCEARGYYDGNLICGTDCNTKDTSDCDNYGRCGDGTLQSAHETCDGSVPPGTTCEDYGFYTGTLACDATCHIVTFCSGQCGDGTLQSAYEDCEGSNLGGKNCLSLGYYGGTLSCQGTCDFDLSSCAAWGRCGDGIIQSSWSEECDGANLAGQSCRTQQYFTGTLACDPGTCWFDETQCTNMISISAGANHTCAVFDDGTVRCWGFNNFGQLGNGTDLPSYVPVLVTGINNAVSISAGESHTCAVLNNGTLKCWGLNADGQLGDGTQSNRTTPVSLSLANVVEVTAGANHTCARQGADPSFVMKCWGATSSNFGQLGNGSTSGSLTPVAVNGGFDDVISLSAGRYFTCSAHSGSTKKVRCWGLNNFGQLGNGGNTDSSIPTQVSNMDNPLMVTAGWGHACAVRNSDGIIKCWGLNDKGQLGVGTYINMNYAQVLAAELFGVQVTAGDKHTCAIDDAGEVFCWGLNTNGQLGNNTWTQTNLPTLIYGTYPNVWRIDGGGAHTCMFPLDGKEAFCWGYNQWGQVGDDSNVTTNLPTIVRP